jgi:hypothetical protein
MDAVAVHFIAAEGRDECRVCVHDAVWIFADEFGSEKAHEACEYDEVNGVTVKGFQHFLIKASEGVIAEFCEILAVYGVVGDGMFFRAFKRVGIARTADDYFHRGVQASRLNLVNDILQRSAAAGD